MVLKLFLDVVSINTCIKGEKDLKISELNIFFKMLENIEK